MDEEREMVLRMLKEGKITVEEADALLQELVEQRSEGEGGSATAPRPLSSPGGPDVREELRTVFQDLMDSIPKDVVRELKHAGEAFRPGFFHVVRGLRGLAEGRAETTVEETMRPGEQVILSNAWGDVAFGVSPDERLRLRAIKRVWAETVEDAQREAEALPVEVRRQGTSIEIGVPRPVRRHQRSRVDFHLAVPPDVNVRVDVAKGDVEAEALRGRMDLRVARGDVKIRGHEGVVELDVVSGDIHLGTIRGDVRLNVIHGDVAAARVTGSVDVETKSGDIALTNARPRDVRMRTLCGDVEVSLEALGAGPLTVETISGDIEVGLPASARATIDAATRSGEVHSTFALQQTAGDRRSLRGILNAPAAMVRLSATSGDIEIRESRR